MLRNIASAIAVAAFLLLACVSTSDAQQYLTPYVQSGGPAAGTVIGPVAPAGVNLGYPTTIYPTTPYVGGNVIGAGVGQGVRVGPPIGGVQYGGGQIVRYGTPRAGVLIGGGQGYRIGTPRAGVQYGGGQILRYGTPRAGVSVGGREGIRFGTRRAGVKIDAGGLQIGRFRW